MSRPKKLRRVEFIPHIQNFIPEVIDSDNLTENILNIEELEALRLKDLQHLEQEECAKNMEVSRQTFQRVLSSAREKIADSLINGKAIRIEGGNFTRNICPVHCLDCGKEWDESYENLHGKIIDITCPSCGSKKVICTQKKYKKFCNHNKCCKKRRG